MDSKTIDFINYHAASYVNEFMSGDSTTRARMQEILTSFGKQLIDCYPREGKESTNEPLTGNCIKPDVNQQRELLLCYENWREQQLLLSDFSDEIVDAFLQSNSG